MTQPTLQQYKPSDIVQHPDNPRDDVGDVTDLAASIGEVGLLEPVVVAPAHDGMDPKALAKGQVLLIAGHRRLKAAVEAGLPTIPGIFRGDLTTRAAQIEAMLVENLHRADLSPVEEAHAYQLLLDIGDLTQTQLAQHVGQPKTRVRDRLKLNKLPEGVQTRIHSRDLTLTDAAAFLEFADEPDLVKKVEKAIGSSDFQWTLRSAVSTAKTRAEFRSTKAAIDKAGIPSLDERPESWRPDSPVSSLYHAADRLGLPRPLTTEAIVEHRDKIPGLAVWVEGNRVDFYCDRLAPEVVDTDLPQTPEELEARKVEHDRQVAEEREREELQGKLDAAASVRREHVSGVLHAAGDDALAKQRLITFLLDPTNETGLDYPISSSTYWAVLAPMLRLAVDVDVTDRRALVERKLNKLALPALVILTTLNWAEEEYLTMTRVLPHYKEDERYVEWVHSLTDDLAYEWSDFERQHIGLDETGHIPGQIAEDEGQEGAA